MHSENKPGSRFIPMQRTIWTIPGGNQVPYMPELNHISWNIWGYTKHLFRSGSNYPLMEMSDGLELSPRKVEYVKYIFEKEGAVRTNEIASRFNVDPSTITKTITELAESDLVTYTRYHGVSLSGPGRQYAKFLIKRHRILSLMLTHFGLSHEQACIEVSRFESLVSKDAIDRICKAMGHPNTGICGEITHDSGCLEI
jgi:DtxR family transcriptional regulator, Mn-dependent transcriptional regulator